METESGLVLVSPLAAPRRPVLEAAGYRTIGTAELTPATAKDVRAMVAVGYEPFDHAFMENLSALGVIVCVTVGSEGVDLEWCRRRGVAVTNGAGLNADDVADMAMGLVIAGWRGIIDAERLLRSGGWRPPFGPSLGGRTLGIVGLGAIGRAVARRAEAFRLQVRWWGPREKPEAPWPRAASLLDLATDSDILVIAASADESNRHMVSRQIMDAIGPQGMLVNVGRGSLVDEAALIAALRERRLGRAALDVFESEPASPEPWAGLEGVIITPHIASGTTDAVRAGAERMLENLRRYFAGEPLISAV